MSAPEKDALPDQASAAHEGSKGEDNTDSQLAAAKTESSTSHFLDSIAFGRPIQTPSSESSNTPVSPIPSIFGNYNLRGGQPQSFTELLRLDESTSPRESPSNPYLVPTNSTVSSPAGSISQITSPSRPVHHRTQSASVSTAACNSDVGSSNIPGTRIESEAERRRRNTLASARFRERKRERTAQLSNSVQTFQQQIEALTTRISELEAENRYLRGLIVESNRNDLVKGKTKEQAKKQNDNK